MSAFADTIMALATPPGRGALALVRVSGPQAYGSACALAGRDHLKARHATLCRLRDPVTDATLDQALVTFYPAPHSFTGEDCAEYTLHGGKAVITRVLAALGGQAGHRLAQPGEFTRRAFDNGKLDLTEAEAVHDLIAAETEWQCVQALDQLGGSLKDLYTGWADTLTHMLAYLEAHLDFPDEDIPDTVLRTTRDQIGPIHRAIMAHLMDGRRGERLRDGVRVVIAGAPNAGKSSLLNALAQRDVAIVSALPGTTRDSIDVHLDLAGYPVIVTDTAGLRTAVDPIEQIGITRTREKLEGADLVILLFDKDDPDTRALCDARAILVSNKIDRQAPLPGMIPLSVTTGTGMDDVLQALTMRIRDWYERPHSTPLLTRSRHRASLEACANALDRAQSAPIPELIAEDLRLALRSIGTLTGRVDVDDLLDIIFRDFCIGK